MKQGEGLEKYIIEMCHRDGFTLMGKTDPPVRILKWFPKNQFKGCFETRGPLDITGSAGGWHAEIEVKDCKGMRWPMSKLRPHQLNRMRLLINDKSLTALALRLRGATANDDHVFLVPAQRVLDMAMAEKKSITLSDLEDLEKEGLVIRHEYRKSGSISRLFGLLIDETNEPL